MTEAAEKTPEQTTEDGAEPSMEEILASIRRIISDDDEEGAEKPVEEKAAEVAPAPEPATEEPKAAEPVPAPEPEEPKAEKTPEPVAEEPKAKEPADEEDILELSDETEEEVLELDDIIEETPTGPALVSPVAQDASISSLTSLYSVAAKTALGDGTKTLEEIVKECLKPMLKDWLDAQLPGMVEKIVATEIERLIRRAG